MAGRGPAPKDPGQRRRRNKPPELEVLPAEGYQGKKPELAKRYRLDGSWVSYLSESRRWFEAWAGSPMATKFTEVDWNRLRFVIAPLFDQMVRTGARETAGELRLQEEKLGATVMDRQRLRMTIGGEPAAPDEPERPATSRQAASRRARMAAV